MTTPTIPGAPARADHQTDLGPAAERGRTTITGRAAQRIATQAVTEIDGVGGSATRLLGVPVGDSGPDRSAAVTAHISGDTTTLDVRLSVTYPLSVARTTEHTRTHLTRRVEELTGLTVTRVDITVTALHSGVTATRRVE